MADVDEVIAAKRQVEEELLARPGVTGVGVGFREVGGELTDETVIRIYVEAKRPADEVPSDLLIPSEINGHRTDVVEKTFRLAESPPADSALDKKGYTPAMSGGVFPYNSSNHNPLLPGYQIQVLA
jgi:hypothetical protein